MTPEEERQMKEHFEGFPIFDKGGPVRPSFNPGDEWGASVTYPYLNRDNPDDWFKYLKEIEEAGFEKVMEPATPLAGRTYGAIFRKNGRIYTVRMSSSGTVLISKREFNPVYKAWGSDRPGFSLDELFDADIEEVFSPFIRKMHTEDLGDVCSDFPENPEDIHSVREASIDCGGGFYKLNLYDVSDEEIAVLKRSLEEKGYQKTAENKEGVGKRAFSVRFDKDRHAVHLLRLTKTNELFVHFTMDEPLSPYLNEDYYKKQKDLPGRKLRLHMLELFVFGNSFLFELPNGHFVMNDGGFPHDAKYLLDYLEELSGDRKPVIDAWVISHGHGDHVGIFATFVKEPELLNRISVNGFYYSVPNDLVLTLDPGARSSEWWMREAVDFMKTEEGEKTPFYTPHIGERYFFSGMTMEIAMAQEQLPFLEYSGDYNDSSTWYYYTIGEQKLLFGGDGDKGGFNFITKHYDEDFGNVDFLTSLHHGHNTRESMVDYFNIKTLLCSSRYYGPDYRREWNDAQMEKSEECFPYGLGTRVFAFPYRVGESVLLPHNQWKYHSDVRREAEKPFTRLEEPSRFVIWRGRWLRDPHHRKAPVYRKKFTLTSEYPMERATLFITATGIYDVLVNGERVTSAFLPPYKSEPRYLQVQRIDLMNFLNINGENEITVTVSDGWFREDPNEIINPKMELEDRDNRLALLAELNVKYQNGIYEFVPTDPSWEVGEGKIVDAKLRKGEIVDETKELSSFVPADMFDGPIEASTHNTDNEPWTLGEPISCVMKETEEMMSATLPKKVVGTIGIEGTGDGNEMILEIFRDDEKKGEHRFTSSGEFQYIFRHSFFEFNEVRVYGSKNLKVKAYPAKENVKME